MKKLMLVLGLIGAVYLVEAQTVISSSGAHFEKQNAMLSQTIGESIVFTGLASNVIVTQGFHQNIYTLTNILQLEHININVFPNPVSDLLTVTTSIDEQIKALLTNNNGQEVKSFDVQGESKMNISELPTGIYFITLISNDNKVLAKSKLVKN